MSALAGMTGDAWIEKLRARMAHGHDYRDADVDRDALTRVVESPASAPDARAAAALMLRWLGLDADERARVARVRIETANPQVRVALEAALDGDEASAERATRRLGA